MCKKICGNNSVNILKTIAGDTSVYTFNVQMKYTNFCIDFSIKNSFSSLNNFTCDIFKLIEIPDFVEYFFNINTYIEERGTKRDSD